MSSAVATTPTIVLSFEDSDIDLTSADHVYVSLKNGRNGIVKKDNQLTIQAKQITFTLQQNESLQLGEGIVRVQVNWTYDDGLRASSDISTFVLSEQLLQGVVS